jgi:hypothetical protein
LPLPFVVRCGRNDHCVSAGLALIQLWAASRTQASAEELTAAYDDCIEIGLAAFSPFGTEAEFRYHLMAVRSSSAAHNAQICAAIATIGINANSAQIGGDARSAESNTAHAT